MVIRKWIIPGDVTTIAGSGANSAIDGTGTAASIGSCIGIVTGISGSAYFTDSTARKIRWISSTGKKIGYDF